MTLDTSIVAWAVAFGCRGVSVEWRALSASIGLATAAGLEVAAWTVRRRPTFDRLARLGVAAICVEGPALDGPGAPRTMDRDASAPGPRSRPILRP